MWAIIGLPLALRLSNDARGWLWAPAIGWGVANVLMLPIFEAIGTSTVAAWTTTAVCAAISIAFVPRQFWREIRFSPVLALAVIFCAALSFCMLAGVLPKLQQDGAALSSPIFDHSKIALVDEIIRSGVPAQNPFFHETGAPGRVAYYYLWHFSAAVVAILTNSSGWEADAALTGFTAFASLLATVGLALRWGGTAFAAVLVGVLSAATSLRAPLDWIWPEDVPEVVADGTGFGGWLFQTSWAPQHAASAMCVLAATLIVPAVLSGTGWLSVVALGLLAAAAYQSSIWVGGVILPLALAGTALLYLARSPRTQWPKLIGRLAISAAIAGVFVAPFLYDQIVSASLRQGVFPITIQPAAVLDSDFLVSGLGRFFNLPAFWTLYLPIELPAVYIAGLIGLWSVWRATDRQPLRPDTEPFVVLAAVSLGASWMLASVIGDNNDLGWRGALPAILVLTAAAARLICAGPAKLRFVAAAVALVGLTLSLPDTVNMLAYNLQGDHYASGKEFAASEKLWDAVRRQTPASELVGNNPSYLADMTPWPVNISWALLANRRSCFAGPDLALPFAPISAARRDEITKQFQHVFDGNAQANDIEQLANRFGCDTIVLAPTDGAWRQDPFASNVNYRVVENNDAWRIYRKADRAVVPR